jgi:ankyrin repeat protein
MNVDIYDENGMTPLQHAAYKGNKEIVQMLLDQVSVEDSLYLQVFTSANDSGLGSIIMHARN